LHKIVSVDPTAAEVIPDGTPAEARRVPREELGALAAEWAALAAAASDPNPFYEPWALLPAAEAAPAPLECVAVRAGGVLAALFPFEPLPRYRGLPLRVLRSWRNRHLLHCAPLVRAGFERVALAALLAWARAERAASIVQLDYLPADGALAAALKGGTVGWRVAASFERAILRRAAGAEAYLAAALDGNTRRELRRKERRLNEAGAARYVRLGPDGDVARWIDDFLRLEASGWKGAAGGALACTEADRRFGEAIFAGAFERGRLLACGLDLDGRPIAREMCVVAGEGAFSFRIAYDESCARYAPGLLTELETVRAFHEATALAWLDSFTGAENVTIGRLWKDRRRIERVDLAVDGLGAAALALASGLQRLKGAACGRTSSPRSSPPARSSRPPARSRPGGWARAPSGCARP
jgi:CelD/BcsL family acetyltransferase involved in cellulose biosynthesis